MDSEWAIGYLRLSVTHSNAGSLRTRVQRSSGNIATAGIQLLGKLHQFLQETLTLRFWTLAKRLFVMVNQQHVFHIST